MSVRSRLSWLARKGARGLRGAVASRLYRDTAGDSSRCVLVAGAGRSGTTWLADALCSELHARLMFEPFHPRLVPEFAGHHYFHYLRPEQDDEELERFARRVFEGRLRNRWVDRKVELLRPRRRLVKDIRACLLLPWLRRRFPEVPQVFILRHPCAVVASRLSLRWATDEDIAPFLEQEPLVTDHLADRLDYIRSLRTDEEKHALVWCVSNLVPLRTTSQEDWTLVHYERLWSEPEAELARVFAALGHDPGASVAALARRPSSTTRPTSAVHAGADVLASWRRSLAPLQVRRVLDVVEEMGLGGLYGEGDLPRVQPGPA